jgi:hypothetical protein
MFCESHSKFSIKLPRMAMVRIPPLFENAATFLQKNSETRFYRTARDRPFLFAIIGVCYNQVNLCSETTNLPLKSVRYNRVFVNNRVRYNRV